VFEQIEFTGRARGRSCRDVEMHIEFICVMTEKKTKI
jgi:hypothetical protein